MGRIGSAGATSRIALVGFARRVFHHHAILTMNAAVVMGLIAR